MPRMRWRNIGSAPQRVNRILSKIPGFFRSR